MGTITYRYLNAGPSLLASQGTVYKQPFIEGKQRTILSLKAYDGLLPRHIPEEPNDSDDSRFHSSNLATHYPGP